MWPFSKKPQRCNTGLTEFTPEMIEEARNNPGGYVYAIEGVFGPEDTVPPESIKGAYKVDLEGNLTGEYQPNPNFRSIS